MARALRITFSGAFYHVTSRGNERKAVFKSIRDREKLLEYLESATQRYDALIHAYCLMDNHYHLLQYTGKKLKDIGLQFGIGESGVSRSCRRVAQKIEKDKKLKKKVDRLEKLIYVKNEDLTPRFSRFSYYGFPSNSAIVASRALIAISIPGFIKFSPSPEGKTAS
jgi:REP element-mobilizing transposase RayT